MQGFGAQEHFSRLQAGWYFSGPVLKKVSGLFLGVLLRITENGDSTLCLVTGYFFKSNLTIMEFHECNKSHTSLKLRGKSETDNQVPGRFRRNGRRSLYRRLCWIPGSNSS